MKKELCIIALCFAVTMAGDAYAHSGRVDANGGHTNRKTGEYHFHTRQKAQKKRAFPESVFPKPPAAQEKTPGTRETPKAAEPAANGTEGY